MDGFRANEGIIVLGATNRPSELDKALLRPGRFDTKVEVTNPDIKGRKAILELYLSKVKYSSSLDVDRIAQRTVGFSGADLQNLVNTAAVRAAQKNREHVTMSEIEYAYDKQGIFKKRIIHTIFIFLSIKNISVRQLFLFIQNCFVNILFQ